MKAKTIKLNKDRIYSLCSCGLSNKLPFCDNNHRSFNEKKKCSYKSVKIKLTDDSNVEIKCSNWINRVDEKKQ